MRYRYHNLLYQAHGSPHGDLCDPVRRPDGRCIVSRDKALVRFGDGTEAVVIRRCLRLTKDPPQGPDLYGWHRLINLCRQSREERIEAYETVRPDTRSTGEKRRGDIRDRPVQPVSEADGSAHGRGSVPGEEEDGEAGQGVLCSGSGSQREVDEGADLGGMIIRGDSNAIPLADSSVDCVVTDPPYGLSFMGKDWDRAVPSVAIWTEVLRVLKPGGFAAILCAPRLDCQTQMGANLAAAGFVTGFSPIYWTFATGFPKAANLSKLADKRAGVEREVVGPSEYSTRASDKGQQFDGWSATDTRVATLPATPEAKALDGAYAGLQLKPAVEVILIVMRPLAQPTYLDQALANGKGCSWLDDGRIPTGEMLQGGTGSTGPEYGYNFGNRDPHDYQQQPSGRFPANLICSDDVLNDGRVSKGGGGPRGTSPQPMDWGKNSDTPRVGPSDSGSYSRYFDLDAWSQKRFAELPEEVREVYPWLIVPKPSKREKNAGLDRAPVTVDDGRAKPIDNPFLRGKTERVNSHSTVKPVRLMSYLITLFSRPGDLVLDPFVGSGTTSVSAAIMGRCFVGVELLPEHASTAHHRALYALEHDGSTMAYELSDRPAERKPEAKRVDLRQGSLFND